MKPIIKCGLWQRRWSTVFWSLSVIAFIVLTLVFYPSFKDQAAELQKSLTDIPDTAAQFLGGNDFFSPVGYLNSQVFFIMLPMLLSILTISLGSKLLASEEQDHTIESLLARPISRSRLITGKMTVGVAILALVTLATLVSTVIIVKIVDIEVPIQNMAVATLGCFLLALSFGAIAFLLTSLGKARALSLGLTSAIAIGGYIISSLATTVTWLDIPSKFLPFEYYESELMLRGTYNWTNMLILLAVTVVCGVLAWLSFRKRDIY